MSSSAAEGLGFHEKPRALRFYLWAWLPVLLAIIGIAIESQPFFGADHTTGPLRWLIEWLAGPIADDRWNEVHFILRKCGHFLGYGTVSFTWFRAFWMTLRMKGSRMRRRLSAHALAMLGTFLVASADEFHQSFLPNRTGTPVDVGIDCGGALVIQGIIFLVMLRFFRERASG